MADAEALFTIAEMAIALAGFSAVVAAFTIHGKLTETDRSRFVWLFVTAFTAALLAFVPTILTGTGLTDAALWRASSGIMIVLWLILTVPFAVGLLRDRRDSSFVPQVFSQRPLILVPSVLNLALQLLNVWGAVWEPSAAIYIVGTLAWLSASAIVFMSIVLERPAA
jgi:hypothetical protein